MSKRVPRAAIQQSMSTWTAQKVRTSKFDDSTGLFRGFDALRGGLAAFKLRLEGALGALKRTWGALGKHLGAPFEHKRAQVGASSVPMSTPRAIQRSRAGESTILGCGRNRWDPLDWKSVKPISLSIPLQMVLV